jgi:hypothetical protein
VIREQATTHDADDCILGLCEHPAPYLEDSVVDLRVLMGEQALSEPEEMLVPMFM